MIKIGIGILVAFWVLVILAALGTLFMTATLDVVLTGMMFTMLVVGCLGFLTALFMWRIVSRIEKLEREKKGELPKPNF
jgi:uncharacterized membrane protein (DUF485 family)